jgi:hypothetical protein
LRSLRASLILRLCSSKPRIASSSVCLSITKDSD